MFEVLRALAAVGCGREGAFLLDGFAQAATFAHFGAGLVQGLLEADAPGHGSWRGRPPRPRKSVRLTIPCGGP